MDLAPGETLAVGRAAGCGLRVAGDGRVSRRHFAVEVRPTGEAAVVRDLTGGANPVYAAGERIDFERTVAARTVLAAGRTRFRLFPPAAAAAPLQPGDTRLADPNALPSDWATLAGGTLSFDSRTLAAVPVTRPDLRLGALSRLPDLLRTARPADRAAGLGSLILAGVPDAAAVGFVESGADGAAPVPSGWQTRNELAADPPVPPVARRALAEGRPTLAIGAEAGGGWALGVPIADPDAPPPARQAVVVTGESPGDPRERAADLRFVSLVAETVAAADRSSRLERQTAALRPFLPPAVLERLGEHPDPAALAPAECLATVLFCDLRGFSRTSERVLADGGPGDLTRLLDRVSAALSVMTRRIREHGGVTADFLGDAALAFWGWPAASDADAARAAAAALAIAADFAAARPPGDPLAGFRVGVGLATGPAVAGRIGTDEQAKITVFGPVANLASRLEGLSKPLGVPVVCDAATAAAVSAGDAAGVRVPGVRVRPLATVRPAGMERPEAVSELLPPADAHPLTDADLSRYAEAVAAFTAGDWPRAAALLQQHPADDLAQDFLRQHPRRPPPHRPARLGRRRADRGEVTPARRPRRAAPSQLEALPPLRHDGILVAAVAD